MAQSMVRPGKGPHTHLGSRWVQLLLGVEFCERQLCQAG